MTNRLSRFALDAGEDARGPSNGVEFTSLHLSSDLLPEKVPPLLEPDDGFL